MPFTHHSHSGQFCNHATNTLSEMLDKAIERKMSVFSMTEHVPRSNKDLYTGELEAGEDENFQHRNFKAYVAEARRLRSAFERPKNGSAGSNTSLQILIGFEGEWIREDESLNIIKGLLDTYEFDFFVGSVHHVNTVPIDFDKEHFQKAKGDEPITALYKHYFEAQKQMLHKLHPKIVGHFDLIRLYSDDPDRDWRSWEDPDVWQSIIENLEIIQGYGGLLEINSSAVRKGLKEPYPRSEICLAFKDMGGEFVLSDDSHGLDHVGANYNYVLSFLKQLELQHISYLCRDNGAVVVQKMALQELDRHPFWTASS